MVVLVRLDLGADGGAGVVAEVAEQALRGWENDALNGSSTVLGHKRRNQDHFVT